MGLTPNSETNKKHLYSFWRKIAYLSTHSEVFEEARSNCHSLCFVKGYGLDSISWAKKVGIMLIFEFDQQRIRESVQVGG